MHADLLTLCVNAGGAGRRLGGRAKGLLRINHETSLERVLRLRVLASSVLLIANDAAPYKSFQLATVADEVSGKGAPGGLVTALGAAKTPWVLLVACDMPFVTVAASRTLIEQVGDDVDVVVAGRDGASEPLFGLYRTSLYAALRAALDANPSLRSLVARQRHRVVELSDARVLDSLNTPADLERHGAG